MNRRRKFVYKGLPMELYVAWGDFTTITRDLNLILRLHLVWNRHCLRNIYREFH